MNTSLIISTYNNPQFLQLCLSHVLRQTIMPSEVIIADDGSRQDTATLIQQFRQTFPVPLLHVWHEDRGFRAGQIRNKAILAASGDYIIQIDGDILIHPNFVRDHLKFARRGSFVTGSRTLLNADKTTEALATGSVNFNALRLPFLSRFFQNLRASNGSYARGCNMAYWRDDIIAVNGYSDEFVGWGREDSDLSWRLINYGLKKRFIKFAALQYHLDHPHNSRYNDAHNIHLMEQARLSRRTWCPVGIVNSPEPPAGRS